MNYYQIIKEGKAAARVGWKNQFIFVAEILDMGVNEAVYPLLCESVSMPYKHGLTIALKTADNKINFGWNPSMEDIMAEDWLYVNAAASVKHKAEIPT